MSRKIPFEIKDLLGKISFAARFGSARPAFYALWMNFHRVYPEKARLC
jgi:hypothetical protein